MKYSMLSDPKKAAVVLLAMGWLLAATGQVVDGAGFSAKNGGQKWNGTTKTLSVAAVKFSAKMAHKASKKTWRGTHWASGKITASFMKRPLKKVLWKGGKAKKLRRATKMYALGEAGLAGKYISATVAGGRHGGTLNSLSGKKRIGRISP